MTLYETLNIKKTASKDDIKKAYRDKAKTIHPDKGGDKDKFTEIQKAYSILSNDIKKDEYDRTGKVNDNNESVIDSGLLETFYIIIKGLTLEQIKSYDLIDKMKIKIRENMTLYKRSIHTNKEQIKTCNDLKKRFKTKKGKFNLFESAIINDIRQLEKKIEINENMIDIGNKMLKKLECYSYKVDEKNQQQANNIFNYFNLEIDLTTSETGATI